MSSRDSLDTSRLRALGQAVRRLRGDRGETRRDLAQNSGLSERFLADLEGGRGNIALTRLFAVARALHHDPLALMSEALGRGPHAPKRPILALLGLRGAGKSSLGRHLAAAEGYDFLEHDELVEEAAGLSLAELFAVHGEEGYRRYAQRVFENLLDGTVRERPLVLATSGGIVTDEQAFRLLLDATHTVWLKATPEDHWNRVVAQGDGRPMQDRPDAKRDLERLLASREPDYARAAHCIDTSARGVAHAQADLVEIARAKFNA